MKKLIIFAASTIIAITVIVVALILLRVLRIPFIQINLLGASNSLVHWLSWVGTLYIAFTVPVYPIVKRKFPKYLLRALNIHTIGNLLAMLLISIHFAHQVTRSASNYPDLGTGVALYATMVLLVATGYALYSGLSRRFSKQLRFLHPAVALTFYIVIVMHIIHGI